MELSASFTRALLAGFGRSYADLLHAAHRSTGSRDDARDLVHDVWLRLAEHERSGAGTVAEGDAAPRDVTAYLAVMAQHMALDTHRRDQRLLSHVDQAAQQAQMAPQHVPDVAETLMYRQALAVLEQTLAGLPERTRQVFVAHRVQGDRQPEIAARLGVSLNTVERDLIQAGDCIADALQRWRGTQGETAGSGRKAGRRRSLGALLGVAGLGLAGPLAWQQWQGWRHQQVQWQAHWSTPRGQQQRHGLPDGSVLLLDAQSTAQLQFFATRREVRLDQGAAFFDVAHDTERPFSVQAAGVRVVVLGTRFGVEQGTALDGTPQVTVQVDSGRVRVESATGERVQLLTAGEGLRMAGGKATSLPQGSEAAPWRHGELVFTDVPLGEALARLARYAPFALEATPDAARLPVNGRVRIARAQAWVQALPRAMPVRLQPLPPEQGQGWRVAMAR